MFKHRPMKANTQPTHQPGTLGVAINHSHFLDYRIGKKSRTEFKETNYFCFKI